MIRRLQIVCGIATALMVSASSALAFGPVESGLTSQRQDVVDVSFFGRPYPYGFTVWGPCVRYVEVETRWGPRLRRIWVCR